MGSGASSLQQFDALPAKEREAAFEVISAEREPSAFDLTVSGHRDEARNGLYRFAGEENEKPKWVKAEGKIFWNGGAWVITDGEAEERTGARIPAREWGDDVRVSYTRRPKPSASGTWTEHTGIDMCGQGDVQIIHDWKEHKSIDELKRMVEERNLSAFSVGDSFEHAGLKCFDYTLTAEHCRPCEGYTCTLYIYTPPPELARLGAPPARPMTMPADPYGVRLKLVKKGSEGQCVFEHARKLAEGKEFVPLTLKGGDAIVSSNKDEECHAHYHLFPAAVGCNDVAVNARFDEDGGFLTVAETGFVFDVNCCYFSEGAEMRMLREHDDPTNFETRNPDGGRSFKINDDGTISPTHAEHLVFGLHDNGAGEGGKGERVTMRADRSGQRLRLVQKGSKAQCVFEHFEKLADGMEFVPLMLKSGKAIVSLNQAEKVYEHYHLFPPAVGSAEFAVSARFDEDGGFLTIKDSEFVLDVNMWAYSQGQKLWMVREHDDPTRRETRNPDGGRSFKINDDGTISPLRAETLVLGVRSNDIVLDYGQDDVPADFPLPTMGAKFSLSPSSDDNRYVEIFCHNVNCPLIFSFCCTEECAHWYVSKIDKDGAFKLSIKRLSDTLNVRADVADEGEVPNVVRGEGSWFLAEKHGDHIRLRLKNGADDKAFYVTATGEADWGCITLALSSEVSEKNLLIIKRQGRVDGGDNSDIESQGGECN